MDSTGRAYFGTGAALYTQIFVYYRQLITDGDGLFGTGLSTGTTPGTLTNINL